jgi:hypothetical protein
MAMDSDTLKGDRMKSLTLLWKAVADDFATWCCTSASRDFEELTRRFEHEGNSFLTITLPDFGKDFERSLSLGKVDPSLFAGWRKKGGLPLFLGGFLDQVFDRATAAISVDPNVEAIRAIRQLTLMFGKILLPTSEERTRNALIGYVNTEKEVRSMDARRGSLRDFRRVSRTLFGPLIASLDSDVRDFGLWPKHGPGKTADRISGNQKYDLRSWPTRLDAMFPFEEYCIYSPRHLAELDNEGLSLIDEVNFQLPGAELPVRVVCVPKTLKTPRIIAIEPTSMMYAQQAVSRSLVNYLETDDLVGGQIGFRDDHINQYLACVGSRDSSLLRWISAKLPTEFLINWSAYSSALDIRLMLSKHADRKQLMFLDWASIASPSSHQWAVHLLFRSRRWHFYVSFTLRLKRKSSSRRHRR